MEDKLPTGAPPSKTTLPPVDESKFKMPEYQEYKPGIMFSRKVRIIIFAVCICVISFAIFISVR